MSEQDTTTPFGATTLGDDATLEGTIDVLTAVAERDWQVGSTVARHAVRYLTEQRDALAAARNTAIDVEQRLNAAATEVERLNRECTDRGEWLTTAMTRLGDVLRARATFADSVRDAAIEVQHGHASHISKDALNEWLTDLGLEPTTQDFTCEGTWNGIDMPSARVTAVSAEEAERLYREALGSGDISNERRLTGRVRDTDEVYFHTNEVDETEDADEDFDADEVEVEVEVD